MKSLYLAALFCAILAACGGKDNGNLVLGGTVSGLSKPGTSLKLSNGASTITISASSSTVATPFSFPDLINSNSGYDVKVLDQPTAAFCTVTGGTGTASTSNVSTVTVACITETHTLGGTVTGLAPGRVLFNGADTATIAADGTFLFPVKVADGSPYGITVQQQPSDCSNLTVNGGTGRMGSADVSAAVAVTCP